MPTNAAQSQQVFHKCFRRDVFRYFPFLWRLEVIVEIYQFILFFIGESLRKNRVLISLRLEGLSSLKEVLPVCLSLAESKALQLLDVSSGQF